MDIGDCEPVEGTDDVYCIDMGGYGAPRTVSVFVVDAEAPAVVDTGMGRNYEFVLDALADLGIAPEDLAYVLPTHVHLDHAGGAGYLAEACPNADVLVHEVGARHLVDPERLVAGTREAVGDRWQYYDPPMPIPAERITELTDGDGIDLGDRELAVHHAPGHAPHQVVFFEPDQRVLFSADAAGMYVPEADRVVPTTPPPNFDLEQCLTDIEMLESLHPATICYGHFGGIPADGRLAEAATVLEEWVDSVAAARAATDSDRAAIERLVEASDLDSFWSDEKAHSEVDMNARGVIRYLDTRA
ncbi:MAG: MBL fold metallo-hydrolase [Haloarculaceae archaeon]